MQLVNKYLLRWSLPINKIWLSYILIEEDFFINHIGITGM